MSHTVFHLEDGKVVSNKRQTKPHEMFKCVVCGEPFCIECDVEPSVREAILIPPIQCPLCLKKQQ